MLSNDVSSTIFGVFDMTRLGIEFWSIEPQASILFCRDKGDFRLQNEYGEHLKAEKCLKNFSFLISGKAKVNYT